MRRIVTWVLVLAFVVAGYFSRGQWGPHVAPYLPAQLAGMFPVAQVGGTENAAKKPGGAGAGGGKRSAAPMTVAVAKAELGSLPITRDTIGTIVPLATSNLTGSVTGLLAEVKVGDGAIVKKGDLIAVLDSRAIRATIVKDQATLAKDQATLDNANATLKRTADLAARGIASKQSGDDAATAAKVAEQAVNVDNAVLAADQVALSLTEIHAPYDGKLGTILLSPGSWVGATSVITTITQMDPVYAEFVLPDADVALVKDSLDAGKLVVSVVPQSSKQAKPVTGPVVYVDHAIDPASGTLKMRASLANADGILLTGQAINVEVSVGTLDNLVLVPNVAVTPTSTGNAVYVVKNDSTIDVRPVEIALRGDAMAGLSKGLAAGEQVVTEGQVNLSNGSVVKVSTGDAAAPAADAATAIDPTKKSHKKKDASASATETAAP